MNRNSFETALRIEPEFGVDYELDWGRHSVAIEFENVLPDSTTFIINVSTEFSDLNGNSLLSPQKIAVSSGPEIDEGKITGKVLDARTGEKEKGKRVLLYRTPVDLSKPANYIAETDTGGTVLFSYLRDGDYLAFWVDDRNRNGIWDPQTERAQPFARQTITLEKAGADTLGSLFIADSDTAKPTLSGLGLFSEQRLRLRFSEDITLTDSTQMAISDTLGNNYANVNPLYLLPDEKYILFARSNKPLAEEQSYLLEIQNMTDEAGNILVPPTQTFTGSSQADTTTQRIIYAGNTEGIYPDEGVKITYAKPISDQAIRDSVIVAIADSAITGWDSLRIQQNNLWVMPKEQWQEGVNYEIRVWNPATQVYRKVQPNIWFPADLGSLNITFADSASKAAGRPTRLLLKNQTGQLVTDTTFTRQITINGLAPVSHQLILFQDLNSNGRWDSGQIQPFEAPEPYFIRNEVPVEAGFTGELEVEFKNLPGNNNSAEEVIPDSLSADSLVVPIQKR